MNDAIEHPGLAKAEAELRTLEDALEKTRIESAELQASFANLHETAVSDLDRARAITSGEPLPESRSAYKAASNRLSELTRNEAVLLKAIDQARVLREREAQSASTEIFSTHGEEIVELAREQLLLAQHLLEGNDRLRTAVFELAGRTGARVGDVPWLVFPSVDAEPQLRAWVGLYSDHVDAAARILSAPRARNRA